ncbi:hypothetical protein F4802DRAFT_574342 [Xylaria palmicola]|nr:hypothetical protein F4802DRAFT_574342 [Xylaria palmicola]
MAPLPLLEPSVSTELQCVICKPEFLTMVAAALPALAYPFLPSGPDYSCGSALMWSSSLNLLLHSFNTLAWAFGFGYIQVQFWVPLLTIISCLVGLVRVLRRHSNSEIRDDDFAEAANIVFCVAIYQACRVGHEFLPVPESVASLDNVIAILPVIFWDAGILTAGSLVYTPFTESTRSILCHIATRRVQGWTWLSEDDADNTFEPLWSALLSIAIHFGAPVLLYFQVVALDRVMNATPGV